MFGTVIYEKSIPFFETFINSLQKQTIKNFELLIINDNVCPNKVVNMISNIDIKINLIHSLCKKSASELREDIIKYAIKYNYDLLIFGDSDDYFSCNRVLSILNNYSSEFGFYYNELNIMNTNKDFFNSFLPEKILSYEKIIDGNFLGLTNTAINLKMCRDVLNKLSHKDVIAFDWYLYTYLLLHRISGKYIDGGITYYRIHENNTAGYANTLTEKKLSTGIKVKKLHYRALCSYNKIFQTKLDQILNLEKKLNDLYNKEKYIDYVNSSFKNISFWWENIKLFNKFEEVIK